MSRWRKAAVPAALRGALLFLVTAVPRSALSADAPMGRPVVVPSRTTPVDFDAELLPFLRKNCLACHNARDPEAGVILDSVVAILKGGDSGALVIAGKADESLLMKVAAHRTSSPMPPADNKVSAVALSPSELGLLKLWIDQGAKPGAAKPASRVVRQPLPDSLRPILAMDLAPGDDLVAVSRGPQIHVYDLRGPRFVATLTDPAIATPERPMADVDLVRSLAFDSSGEWLASGGDRSVRLWKRPRPEKTLEFSTGIAAALTALATSKDGRAIALGDENGAIELRQGERTSSLAGHQGRVAALVFSMDGQQLFSIAADKSLRLWNVAEAKPIAAWTTPVEFRALALTAEGDRLIAGGNDGGIRLWTLAALIDVAKAEALPAADAELKGHEQAVTSLATVAGQKDRLLSGGEDGRLRWWSVSEAKTLRTLGHDAKILSVSLRADGARFLSVGEAAARLWNAADGDLMTEVKGDFRAARDLQRADGELFDARAGIEYRKQEHRESEEALKRETANLEGAQKAKETAEKSVQEKTPVAAKAIETRTAAEAKEAEAVAAFQAENEKRTVAQTAVNEADAAVRKANQALEAARAALAKDRQNADLMAAVQTAEAALALAKANKQAADAVLAAVTPVFRMAERAQQEAMRQANEARSKAQEPERLLKDAQNMLVGAINFLKTQGEILEKAKTAVPRAKDAQTAAETRAAEAEKKKQAIVALPPKAFRGGRFSIDGGRLALSVETGDLLLFDGEGRPVDAIDRPASSPPALAFAQDDTLLAAAGNGVVFGWKCHRDWTLARTIEQEGGAATLADRVLSLDFSPDGRWLATAGGVPGSGGELKLWDVATGALVREIAGAHSDTIHGVRFSPDGGSIATASADKLVKLFRASDGELLQTLAGHGQYVLGVAWSADGRSLVSCGTDQVVKLWDLERGAAKRTYRGTAYRIGEYRRAVTSVMFLGGTEHFLASAGDKTVRLHRISNDYDVRAFKDERAFFHAAAITRDGKLVLAGGQDGTLHAWHGETAYRAFSTTAQEPERIVRPK